MKDEIKVKEITTIHKPPSPRADSRNQMEWDLMKVNHSLFHNYHHPYTNRILRSLVVTITTKTSLVSRNGLELKAVPETWAPDARPPSPA